MVPDFFFFDALKDKYIKWLVKRKIKKFQNTHYIFVSGKHETIVENTAKGNESTRLFCIQILFLGFYISLQTCFYKGNVFSKQNWS